MAYINEGYFDRFGRIVLGIALIALAWGSIASTAGAVIVALAGGIALVTGVVGWCPIYRMLGLSTNHRALHGK